MVTAATIQSGTAPVAPLRWVSCESFNPEGHKQSVYVRWLTSDGRALFTTLAIVHDDDEWALIRTDGPELDDEALDCLYDDVAKMIHDGPSPDFQVQTRDEVINGCSHPYAKALQANGWKCPAGVVCSYCHEVL